MHIRRLRGVRDGDDEPDRCRESEDASVEHDVAKNANNNMLQTFRLVFRERGVGGFYVGLTPSLVRATTYGGLRLGLYDPIRRNLASNSEFFGGG